MVFKYTGTDHLAYARFRYYLRLAHKARTLKGMEYWLKVAKLHSIK